MCFNRFINLALLQCFFILCMILIDFSFLIYPRKQPTLLSWPIRRVWVQLICWTYHEHTKVWMERSQQLIALQNAIDRPFVRSTLILLFHRLPATVWSCFYWWPLFCFLPCVAHMPRVNLAGCGYYLWETWQGSRTRRLQQQRGINQGQTHHNDVRACFIVLLPNKMNERNYCCSQFAADLMWSHYDTLWYRFRPKPQISIQKHQ